MGSLLRGLEPSPGRSRDRARPLRGVLVAGGKGARMGELTAEVPKPMLAVGGRPVLGHLVDQLAAAGIRDVVILAGHLHEVIAERLDELGSGQTVPELVVEPKPAGSGGCLRRLGESDTSLVVLFGDVMVYMDLAELIAFHRRSGAVATAAVHPNDHPHDSDLVELDAAGRLVALYKKPHPPQLPVPNLVIAGIFVIEPELLARVPADRPADLVHDVLAPAVAEGLAVYGYRTAEYLKDMGTPARWEQVDRDFESGRVRRPVLSADFVPTRLHLGGDALWVEWTDLGGAKLTEPFFAQSVARRRRERPSSPVLLTPFEELERHAAAGLAPAGFLFHMSRCGSTLVSRLLASVPRCRVISEHGLLSAVLGLRDLGRERCVEALRAALGALGVARPGEQVYVVKLSSWNVLDLDLVRAAFPGTPWIFIHRDPVEVAASLERRPTGWLRMKAQPSAAARMTGLDAADVAAMTDAEYVARALAAFCRAAAAAPAEGRFLLDHGELPGAVASRVCELFGLRLSAGEVAAMEALGRRDAKDPHPDPESRRLHEGGRDAEGPPLSAAGLRAIRRWTEPAYRQLLDGARSADGGR